MPDISIKETNWANLKQNAENLSFVLPAVIIFSIFYVYPFYDIFNLSMHQWNGIDVNRKFIGFDNFIELMGDRGWWKSIWNAGFITFVALTFQNALAFGLALACDREIRMKNFYRVVFFIPPVLSEIVVGLIWRWILNPGVQNGEYFGLLNYFLSENRWPHLVHQWLSDPKTALPCIAIVHSWKGFGWGFIMLLAGLQTIDRQLYEAARVDGAGWWNQFRHVTVPMMVPVILVVVILTVLGSMQVFVLIISMVGSGLVDYTDVPVLEILSAMTSTNRFGYACAMGIVFAGLLIAISAAFKLLTNKMKQA